MQYHSNAKPKPPQKLFAKQLKYNDKISIKCKNFNEIFTI